MSREQIQEKVNLLKQTENGNLNSLINFMLKRGFTIKHWKDINKANDKVLKALTDYFNSPDATLAVSLDENLNQGTDKINLDELKELSGVARKIKNQSNKDVKENVENMSTENLENKNVTAGTAELNNEASNTEDKKEPVIDEVSATNTQPLTDGSGALALQPPTDDNAGNTEPPKTDEVKNEEDKKPEDKKEEDKKPEDKKEEDKKPEDKKEEDKKPEDKKPEDKKPEDKKEEDKKPEDKKDVSTGTGKTTTKKAKTVSDKPKALTTTQIKRLYKTKDNLIHLATKQTIEFTNVTVINQDEAKNTGKYMILLNGKDLAQMWLKGKLVFDPTMQRGVKTNANGDPVATFSDKHVKDIEVAMINGEFEPTTISFALINDDDSTTVVYDEESQTLTVEGLIRLLDGQHRTRSLVKILKQMEVDEDFREINLDSYIFSVEIYHCTADRARAIYAQLDKNLRLDKSQVKQLSTDDYAIIGNDLNKRLDSPLRNKIATAKPVAKGLVLFSTLCDAIERQVKINTSGDRQVVTDYLVKFFDYLTEKLPDAFGGDVEKRMKFRENNLLNESNMFWAWLAVAYADKANYKKNIDTILKNVDYFNKNNKIWLDGQVVKVKRVDKDKPENERGYAIANSTSAFDTIIENTLKLIGKGK